MQRAKVLCLVLLIVITNGLPTEAQGKSPLLNSIVQSIKKKEPQWRFVPGFCTCPPLVPSQKSYAAGGWYLESNKGKNRHVRIYISDVPSVEEAAAWMESMSRWEVAEGWTKERYELGDEGYLSSNRDGSGSTLYFRKGNIIVELNGEVSDVEQFAEYAEKAMPATQLRIGRDARLRASQQPS